jgi:predicted transcriptional regulator
MEESKIVPALRRRRAERCSNPMTADAAAIAKTMVLRLGMAQHVVAAKLGVNQGRISDAIRGKIFPEASFAPLSSIDL